ELPGRGLVVPDHARAGGRREGADDHPPPAPARGRDRPARRRPAEREVLRAGAPRGIRAHGHAGRGDDMTGDAPRNLLISPIRSGTVIDHITAGQALNVLRILGITGTTAESVSVATNVASGRVGRKD